MDQYYFDFNVICLKKNLKITVEFKKCSYRKFRVDYSYRERTKIGCDLYFKEFLHHMRRFKKVKIY